MLVKICGLSTAEHALAATAAGADMLGFVFAPSRRQITPATAATLAAAVRAAPGPHPRLVGLFVNTDPATVNAVAAHVGLDFVQLSGVEPADHVSRIALPIMKAVRMDGSAEEAAWLALWEDQQRWDQRPKTKDEGQTSAEQTGQARPDDGRQTLVPGPWSLVPSRPWPLVPSRPSSLILLVDAHVPGSYGGTGVTADWARAAELARRGPLLLAGGLNPDNVAAAIVAVGPLGVDVSSGVESAGIKDPLKIEAFIGAARAVR
jgi:phosphoribosylanthranilate isomerase